MTLFVAMSLSCSDENGTDTAPDAVAEVTEDTPADTPPQPAGCWTDSTATNFQEEPLDDDWADCIDGCDNDDISIFNFRQAFTTAGWQGRIDGEEHSYAGLAAGPDVDLVGVIFPARTQVTFFVEPTQGSALEPVITVHDGQRPMTRSAGDGFARTRVVNPYFAELPFYFFIEHFPNYQPFRDGSSAFAYEGGDHGYTVRFETAEFAPAELGELSAENTTLNASGQLDCHGDVAYFRFDSGGAAANVLVTRTGGDLRPLVVGMDTTGGQLIWSGRRWDGSPSDTEGEGVVRLPADAFQSGGSGELIFAVTDFDGANSLGATFDVTVQAE